MVERPFRAWNFEEREAMTARQQIARLVSLVLLVLLAIAGLRGAVAAPGWNGPLRADGVAIGLVLEVVLGVLLVITIRRDGAARREAEVQPPAEDDIGVPGALRFVLRWVLALAMVAIAAVLVTNLHLHFFIRPRTLKPPPVPRFPTARRTPGGGGGSLHIPLGPILYGLLIAVLLAAVVISVLWAARLRRAALPGAMDGDVAEDCAGLLDAVESGRVALAAELDDARAAIIACYLAMERTLADRGTARAAADTPDELLARAVTSGIVRGGAARRLTASFYEARFSSHPLGHGQRDAASRALDELAAELAGSAAGAPGTAGAPDARAVP
jgi:hypothetical protein